MSPVISKAGSFVSKVVASDTFKRGVAGAVGTILTAAIAELLFPRDEA
jgi:hypothetical protein